MQKAFSPSDIEHLVPHRFENILVDYVELTTTETSVEGDFRLCVSQDDAKQRMIFFRQKKYGHYSMIAPILMEVIALGSIVCSDKLVPGGLVFFTGISSFDKKSDFPMGSTLTGKVKKIKDKAGFLVCSAVCQVDKTVVAEAQLMAFFPDPAMVASAEQKTAKKKLDISFNRRLSYPLHKNPDLKHPKMYVVDTLVDDDAEQKTAVASYQFPSDHPLVKGHFPGNPVLMGVMQWMMVEDAVLALLKYRVEQGITGMLFKVTGSADIFREDLTSVAEIREFEALGCIGAKDGPDYAEVVKTQKIAFRDRVSPEEEIFIRLSDLVITPL